MKKLKGEVEGELEIETFMSLTLLSFVANPSATRQDKLCVCNTYPIYQKKHFSA